MEFIMLAGIWIISTVVTFAAFIGLVAMVMCLGVKTIGLLVKAFNFKT